MNSHPSKIFGAADMATHVIKKNQTTTVEVTESNSEWIVKKGVTLAGDWALSNTYDNVSFFIEGKVVTTGYGVVSSVDDPENADDISISVGASGRILADEIAVYFDGEGSSVENKGLIKSEGNIGIYFHADAEIRNEGTVIAEENAAIYIEQSTEFLITNNGLLAGGGSDAIALSAKTTAQGKLINGPDGRIEGKVKIDFQSTGDVTLINKGEISANGDSITFGAGDDRIVNRGEITGRIYLYGGDDTVDLRGGALIDSWVEGGAGDDTYFVDGTAVDLRESSNSGNDTIKTTGSYALGNLGTDSFETLTAIGKKNIGLVGNNQANALNGNIGKNTLSGGSGSDTLAGHGGDDTLSGDAGADHFLFHRNGGDDTITDLDFNADVIHIVAIPGIVTPDDLLSHFTSASNGDAIIDLGRHGSIRLAGINVGSVDEIEFQIDL
jgi:Ca2+-binding RTX toxin-like protein